jgi:hypothetical protein
MGVKITGITEVENIALRVETDLKRRVFETLNRKAIEVRDLAIKMAPVDEGNLEGAIKVREAGVSRGSDGTFTKGVSEVYIDMDMPVPHRPGKTVGDYAYEMHEHLFPFGPYNLGDLSEAKQSTNGGILVGGKFMERAALEVESGIDAALAALVKELN